MEARRNKICVALRRGRRRENVTSGFVQFQLARATLARAFTGVAKGRAGRVFSGFVYSLATMTIGERLGMKGRGKGSRKIEEFGNPLRDSLRRRCEGLGSPGQLEILRMSDKMCAWKKNGNAGNRSEGRKEGGAEGVAERRERARAGGGWMRERRKEKDEGARRGKGSETEGGLGREGDSLPGGVG